MKSVKTIDVPPAKTKFTTKQIAQVKKRMVRVSREKLGLDEKEARRVGALVVSIMAPHPQKHT